MVFKSIHSYYIKPYVTEEEGRVIMNNMDFERRSCDLLYDNIPAKAKETHEKTLVRII